ncbi:ZIP family metal transporter (plasmid) [Halococcus dombrowskii]|uniref:ZIP family metal transporter n=1 Tax=Halococcus dombrowskii TaxID=179637 RepID=A0AAV3SM19_HALDO|nr:ZIP family metal transporter [Halococcus dombrowskii]UOO96927.1 ZIP family metal transporter [Halococcus dombrowskii]UOO97573.1 ZIP family metal transporter [Halococcus dombrowskii]
MTEPGAVAFVFVAGLVTALATGLGAIPFFLFDDISDRWNVALWGLASGIMLAASGFGLLGEGLAVSTGIPILLILGSIAGVILVIIADAVLDRIDLSDQPTSSEIGGSTADEDANAPRSDGGPSDTGQADTTVPVEDAPLATHVVAEGDLRKLVLILGILTVHSFPEGVAIGVSFADVGLEGGVTMFGLVVPVLAVFMTIAISIHNIPEGIAISIPLRSMEVSEWRMVGAAVFSSLPQPIGAVIAFAFVSWARGFLPFGFGFAAGAMIYLVITEFIPEALQIGTGLDGGGHRELVAGVAGGITLMLPLMAI